MNKKNGLEDIYFLIEKSQHFASIVLNKKFLKFEDYYPYNEKFHKLDEQFQYAIRVLEYSMLLNIVINENESVSKIFQVHAALVKNHSILMMLALNNDVQRGIKSKDSRNRGIAKSIMSRKEKSDKRTKEIIAAANKLLADGIEQHSIAGVLAKKFNVKIDTIRRALKQRDKFLH